ncbi:MAG: tRNA (N(6)-L-threonylcarbamoyladenosine(37)-C(2))-methylthiotransferase MtaB [Proteobacteria bacterium]|nr:tRNA (N(6)-L-threonylcarbamoyladenosine(37)-C(2))-methylthiotransferase MtaB [Pseudomonadota bacterium]
MKENVKEKVYIAYSGCKVNQFEKNLLEERFIEKEFEIAHNYKSADIVVFNTCCVTKKAEDGCRQQIRKIAKHNNQVKIIVTGCYAQKDRERLYELPNVIKVFDNNEKFSIPEFLVGSESGVKDSLSFEFKRTFKERARAFLKIQDGCDSFCSYCIVPYLRGLPKSMPEELVIKNLINLQGEKEVVLTGIHLGKWGVERGESLKNLIKRVSREKFLFRLRLSSLEPQEIDKEFLNILKDMENFCPHFHIPLQSGSDRILKLMNRSYTTDFYMKKIDLIREYFPDAGIGTDLIVGFPTESDDDFIRTSKLLEVSPIDYIHVFRYSDRDGTSSFQLVPKIEEDLKEKRSELIREIDRKKRLAFYQRFLNRSVRCLLDRKEKGVNRFLTREYLKVYSETIDEQEEFTAELISLNPPAIRHVK